MSAKPKSIRLSPNKRAELISRFEKGEKFDNEDYYVIKDKSGRLNVRKRKQKQSESSSDDVKQATQLGRAAAGSETTPTATQLGRAAAGSEPTPAPEATPAPKPKKEPKTKAL